MLGAQSYALGTQLCAVWSYTWIERGHFIIEIAYPILGINFTLSITMVQKRRAIHGLELAAAPSEGRMHPLWALVPSHRGVVCPAAA